MGAFLDKIIRNQPLQSGRIFSWNDWQHYAIQLITQGFLEMPFQQENVFTANPIPKMSI